MNIEHEDTPEDVPDFFAHPNELDELPNELFASTTLLAAYINHRWPMADEDERSTLFTLAEGLWWYLADHHSGQWSKEYSLMGSFGFSPSPLARGPEGQALEVYRAIRRRTRRGARG